MGLALLWLLWLLLVWTFPGPPPPDHPKFRSFFPSPAPIFGLFVCLWVSSRGILVVFSKVGTLKRGTFGSSRAVVEAPEAGEKKKQKEGRKMKKKREILALTRLLPAPCFFCPKCIFCFVPTTGCLLCPVSVFFCPATGKARLQRLRRQVLNLSPHLEKRLIWPTFHCLPPLLPPRVLKSETQRSGCSQPRPQAMSVTPGFSGLFSWKG